MGSNEQINISKNTEILVIWNVVMDRRWGVGITAIIDMSKDKMLQTSWWARASSHNGPHKHNQLSEGVK